MFNEMIDFGEGVFGLALNLEEDEVGCVVLGDYSRLKEGDEASTTGKLLSVPVGKGLLGRVVDAIGQPVDGKGPIDSSDPIRSTGSHPASFPGNQSTSLCRPGSCRSTR